jgi:hypothetical protein
VKEKQSTMRKGVKVRREKQEIQHKKKVRRKSKFQKVKD